MASTGPVVVPVGLIRVPSLDYTVRFCHEISFGLPISLAVCGSDRTVSMFVHSTDTVGSIKLRIQDLKGLYSNQQRLVYCGRELTGDNWNLIRDCGLSRKGLITVVPRLSVLVNVEVERTSTGERYIFTGVRITQRVKDLKERISEEDGGVVVDDQHSVSFVFEGKCLEDDERIIDLGAVGNVKFYLSVVESPAQRGSGISDESRVLPPVNALPVQSLQPERKVQIWDGATVEHSTLVEPVGDFVVTETPDVLLKVLKRSRSGLQVGHTPVLSSEGSGGTYFMKDGSGKNVAVFKPVDEEPEAVNNPRTSPRSDSVEGLKRGILVGEGAEREVLAFLLDHPVSGPRTLYNRNEEGFAGVPATIMVRASSKAFNYAVGGSKTKVGSLQQFVHSVSSCEDMGPARFPVDEVHKISVLDLRIANTDRNGGNILVCNDGNSSTVKLVPIDHGYCLPDKFEDCTFEWLYWPQSKIPFSKSTLKYIAELDADKDIYILANHGVVLRPECARVFRVATMLLKKGAAAGLTPLAIGSMMSRERFDVKSEIENMLETAEASVSPAASENAFMDFLSDIMDKFIS